MAVFQPTGFLRVAERLYEDGSKDEDQGALRTAVSRAYYAAFLTWREKIRAMDPGYMTYAEKLGGSDVHRAVIEWLKMRGLEGESEYLRMLRRERNKADYDLDVHFERGRVYKILGITHMLVERE